MKKLLGYGAPALGMMVVFACGGGTPKPAEPEPAPTAAPKPAETAPPPASSQEEPKTEPQDAGTPDAEAKKPRGSGAPLTVYTDQTQPTTIAWGGGIFRISATGAELRIPSGAINEARNIIFWVNKKNRGYKGRIGEVYELRAQVPEREYVVGQESPSQPLPTAGDPFVLKLPLPAGKDSANLAVERVEQDARTHRTKSAWTVVPMTKMETADPANRAVFELNTIPDANVHLTTEAPTSP
jgi:hypothetical protein